MARDIKQTPNEGTTGAGLEPITEYEGKDAGGIKEIVNDDGSLERFGPTGTIEKIVDGFPLSLRYAIQDESGLTWFGISTTGAVIMGRPLQPTPDLIIGVDGSVTAGAHNQIEQRFEIELTAAEVNALSTPQELIAAPGANKVISVTGGYAKLTHAGAAFATSTEDLRLQLGTDNITAAEIKSGLVTNGADGYDQFSAGEMGGPGGINQALSLHNLGVDYTAGGTSTIKLGIYYRITDFN